MKLREDVLPIPPQEFSGQETAVKPREMSFLYNSKSYLEIGTPELPRDQYLSSSSSFVLCYQRASGVKI